MSGTGTIAITVKNSGAATHALAVQTPSGIVRTGSIAPGQTAVLKVDASTPGRYAFYCPIDGHRKLGMQGILVVGNAAGGARGSGSGSGTSPSGGSGY